MFDRHSLDTVSLLERATKHAREFGHSYVGIEHLLLAFADRDGSPQAAALEKLGMGKASLSQQIEKMFGRNEAHFLNLRFTAELKDLLETAKERYAPRIVDAVTSEQLFEMLMAQRSGTVENICRAMEAKSFPADPAFASGPDSSTAEFNVLAASATNPIAGGQVAGPLFDGWPVPDAPPHSKSPARSTYNQDIPMAEGDFTESANWALNFARVEAATVNFSSRVLDTKCLLIGLAMERSGNAGKQLRDMKVTARKIRGNAGDELSQKLVPKDLECLLADANFRRVIQSARKASRKRKSEFVSTVDLLAAILSGAQSTALKILSHLVADVALLKSQLPLVEAAYYEGSTYELTLNERIFDALIAGERPAAHLLEESSDDQLSAGLLESFDLSHLDAESLAVMEAAMREYATLQSTTFGVTHLLLGLVASKASGVSKWLLSWGISVPLVRNRIVETSVAEREKLLLAKGTDPDLRVRKLDDSVVALLNSALARAKKSGERLAAPEHLFYALATWYEPELKQLVESFGMDTAVLKDAAESFCDRNKPSPAPFLTDFIRPSRDGLLIYSIICEPAVGVAVHEAMQAAMRDGVKQVSGAHLLCGLAADKGETGEILRSLGLRREVVEPVVRKMFAPSPEETTEMTFADDIEYAFDRGLILSLSTKRPALSARDLLSGLLETENPSFLQVLDLCNISPIAIWGKLDTSRKNVQADVATMQFVERIVSTISKPVVSKDLFKVFEIASNIAASIGANNIDLNVLLLAFSHAGAGPVADKLFISGFDRAKLLADIEKKGATIPRAAEPHVDLVTLAVVAEAERIAEQLDSETLECEHVMFALLSACTNPAHSHILRDYSINASVLSTQLSVVGESSTQASKLEFGPQLARATAGMDLAARTAIINAGVLAIDAGRNFIDTEHLLAGICVSARGSLRGIFKRNGITYEALLPQLDRIISKNIEYCWLPMTISTRVSHVFHGAFERAAKLSGGTIGIVDLTMSLLEMEEGGASLMLGRLGVVRKGLANTIARHATAAPLAAGALEGPKVNWEPVTSQSMAGLLESAGLKASDYLPQAGQPEPAKNEKVEIDMSVFDARTLNVFLRAQDLAEKYHTVVAGLALIEPVHFFSALLLPECLGENILGEKISSKTVERAISNIFPAQSADEQLPIPSGVEQHNPNTKSGGRGKTSKSKQAKASSKKGRPATEDESGQPEPVGQPEQTPLLRLEFSSSVKQFLASTYFDFRGLMQDKLCILPEHLLISILKMDDDCCQQLCGYLSISPGLLAERAYAFLDSSGQKNSQGQKD